MKIFQYTVLVLGLSMSTSIALADSNDVAPSNQVPVAGKTPAKKKGEGLRPGAEGEKKVVVITKAGNVPEKNNGDETKVAPSKLVPEEIAIKSPPAPSLDAKINRFVGDLTGPFVATIFHSEEIAGTKVPLIVGWLVIAALIFTLFFGFIQVRGI